MKRTILLLAAAAVALAVAGCSDDESKPTITRIFATPSCGVAPLDVEVYGVASGGNETGAATGGNNNLEFTWDFGDGTSSTSISYHTYALPDTYRYSVYPVSYTVRLRVEDQDGNSATASLPVEIFADSLMVEAVADPAVAVAVGDTVRFDYRASSCGVDPDSETDRSSYLVQRWNMGDGTVYTGASPRHTYAQPGTYEVVATVTYTGWAVTRMDTIAVEVTAAP
jgi:PKD repeat protein